MTVAELRAALAFLPDNAPVVAVYEAGTCESDDLAVFLTPGGRVEIDCDAFEAAPGR